MVITTFSVVLLRYLFDIGWIAMQESITYMHALVFLIGAGYTLRHNGHVRVDIFYRKMGERSRSWVDLLGTLLLLLPLSGFILWYSWEYVTASWSLLEGSRGAGGIPATYLLKSAILIMGLLLIVEGAAKILHCLLVLAGADEESDSEGEGVL
ncbi:TRAP transporter small permease subunit [Candidatus Reidiella endopervernicosa]|nr:TRAP transporter small permease subunit [Candidatus Reidiella endopervernicosa]